MQNKIKIRYITLFRSGWVSFMTSLLIRGSEILCNAVLCGKSQKVSHVVFLLPILVLLVLTAKADTKWITPNFKQLNQLPILELEKKGLYYLNECEMPDSALLCFTLVANRDYKALKDTAEMACYADCLRLLSLMYTDSYYHDYVKEYSYLLLSEKLAEQIGFKPLLSVIHLGKANLFLKKEAINEAPEYQDKILKRYADAYQYAIKENVTYALPYIVRMRAGLAISYDKIDKVEKDLEYYSKIKFEKKEADKNRDAQLFCKGILAYHHNRDEEALALIDSAIAYAWGENEHAIADVKGIYLNIKTSMFRGMGRYDEELQWIDSMMVNARRFDNHAQKLEAYQYYKNYYKEHGSATQAQEYELLYLREKDLINNGNKLMDTDKAQFLFDIHEMEDDLRLQARRHELLTVVAWSIAAIAATVIICLLLLYCRYRQLHEKNRLLYQRMKETLLTDKEKQWLLTVEARSATEASPAADEPPAAPKYEKNHLTDAKKEDLMHRIFMVMETAKGVYEADFSLAQLASMVDATPNNVSMVINEQRQMNFNQLLAEYRIKEACRRMDDAEHYGHLSIEGIAASVGIKSRSNFTVLFKRVTGLTPSSYQRMTKENFAENRAKM